MPSRTPKQLRRLSADDLSVGGAHAVAQHGSNRPDDPPLAADDPILTRTKDLLETYGGVIFTGPPGTSKSWYASKIAWHLTDGAEDRRVFLQFHPSYQYEDFMLGLVPKAQGDGFELILRPFLKMCEAASIDPGHTYVIVIDELSRADPGRVFGEALTYVERSKRGLPFRTPMGEHLGEFFVPDNLTILATMNPQDRGVDEVDAAFERRFAKIAMEPDRRKVSEFLEDSTLDNETVRRLLGFFDSVNRLARDNPLAAVGHTFFMEAHDEAGLRMVWEHQLRFVLEKAFRLNPAGYAQLESDWNRIFDAPSADDSDATS